LIVPLGAYARIDKQGFLLRGWQSQLVGGVQKESVTVSVTLTANQL
jgi:hypothetical protein